MYGYKPNIQEFNNKVLFNTATVMREDDGKGKQSDLGDDNSYDDYCKKLKI